MSVNDVHDLKETLSVDINVPGHEERVTTALFTRSRKALIEREKGQCWMSGFTGEQAGHPLEAHHHPIERSMANMIDWDLFAADAKAGHWGPYAAAFNWDAFFEGATVEKAIFSGTATKASYTVTRRVPRDPYLFVDDMTVNGLLLAKQFHTGVNEGIHTLPYPLWITQRYGKEGYVFSSTETIHHEIDLTP